tara:strand:- start:27902 stop:28237 length:336 start_codon:yes stop_codon:yes gene_type:complete
MIEKCWKIKEERPIIVKIEKSWSGDYMSIKVTQMKMEYETWEDLSNTNLSKEQIKYGESINRVYTPTQHKEANDVSGSSYCYKTGEAHFTASTIEDVTTWLEKNNQIIVKA